MIRLIHYKNFLQESDGRKLVIYGAGEAKNNLLEKFAPAFFCDVNASKLPSVTYKGVEIPVIPPCELADIGSRLDIIIGVSRPNPFPVVDKFMEILPKALKGSEFDVRIIYGYQCPLHRFGGDNTLVKDRYIQFLKEGGASGEDMSGPGIRCMSRREFDALEKATAQNGRSYYTGRWSYLEQVVSLIESIPDISRVIELGGHYHSVVSGADVIVKHESDVIPVNSIGQIYYFDATDTPWPIQKQYDLFISLQTWEHLGTSQARAFKEVIRIADSAVLSFPYQWHLAYTNCHSEITFDRIQSCPAKPRALRD